MDQGIYPAGQISADPAAWVASEMARCGLSKADVAHGLGVTAMAVGHWLSGSRRPSLASVLGLLGMFGYEVVVRRV